MEPFEEVIVEVIELEETDIITTSCITKDDFGGIG